LIEVDSGHFQARNISISSAGSPFLRANNAILDLDKITFLPLANTPPYGWLIWTNASKIKAHKVIIPYRYRSETALFTFLKTDFIWDSCALGWGVDALISPIFEMYFSEGIIQNTSIATNGLTAINSHTSNIVLNKVKIELHKFKNDMINTTALIKMESSQVSVENCNIQGTGPGEPLLVGFLLYGNITDYKNSLYIKDSYIAYFHGKNGGAISIEAPMKDLIIMNSAFCFNEASNYGGVFYSSHGNIL